MSDLSNVRRLWEVRPTLRLVSPIDQATWTRVEDEVRKHPDIAFVSVGSQHGPQSEGITATIALAQPSTPGTAVDKVVEILTHACITTGVAIDVLKEVVVAMADVDPRSL